MAAQDEQLHHLSHELHDELGQSLTAVSSYLRSLEQQLPAHFGDLRERVAEARRLVAKTVGDMREISQGLLPPGLDLYGLGPSLEGQLKAFGERHRLITHFSATGLPDSLPAPLATAIYRVAQEALSNVARHARAHHVHVALEARPGELQLDVQDDGVGLPAGNGGRRAGTGLIGVRERVRGLGGTVTIVSGSGTLLSVTLPLPSDGAAAERHAVELTVEPAAPVARRASPD
jgi:signal transduction histidine kinase